MAGGCVLGTACSYMNFKTYIQAPDSTKSYIYDIQCLHVIGNSFRDSLSGHSPLFLTPEHGISTPEHPNPELFGLMIFYSTPLLRENSIQTPFISNK